MLMYLCTILYIDTSIVHKCTHARFIYNIHAGGWHAPVINDKAWGPFTYLYLFLTYNYILHARKIEKLSR